MKLQGDIAIKRRIWTKRDIIIIVIKRKMGIERRMGIDIGL
jgi:hypothetical protein